MAQLTVIQKIEAIHVRFRQVAVADTESNRVDELITVLQVTDEAGLVCKIQRDSTDDSDIPLKIQGPNARGIGRQVGELVTDAVSQHVACSCIC
jgi:hypothetical protein